MVSDKIEGNISNHYSAVTVAVTSLRGRVLVKEMLNMALFTGLNHQNPLSVFLLQLSASSACSLYLSPRFPFPMIPCPLHLSSPKYLTLILALSRKVCPSFIICLQIDYLNNNTVGILHTSLMHKDI